MVKNGTLVQVSGMEVWKKLLEKTNRSVQMQIAKKFDDIHSAILKSNDALVSSKPHQNFLVFLFFKPITLRLLTLDRLKWTPQKD